MPRMQDLSKSMLRTLDIEGKTRKECALSNGNMYACMQMYGFRVA